jgi:hypothetical protein
MSALIDHLWQSLLCVALLAALAVLTRGNAARVRLWIWRVAAVKLLLPFSVLSAIGAWFGFPARFPGDPPPASLLEITRHFSPWFAASTWPRTTIATSALLALLLPAALVASRWILGRIHLEALRSRVEELRRDTDPDDREPGVGFFRAVVMTACAFIVLALPLLGGALDASAHGYEVLQANTRHLTAAKVTLRPAKDGLGSRYFVDVNPQGVLIRNITLRELTGMAYGVNRFFVRGKHFRDGDDEDWLVDSRHDVRIDGPVLEPDRFDTYALRHAITRELAKNFGLEIYVNSECQKPCGKWGDRVLVEVAPDSWALVSTEEAGAAASTPSTFSRIEEPARARFDALIAAFNSRDSRLLSRHLDEHVSVDWKARPSTEEALALLEQTGGFDVLKLEQRGPNELHGWVRARDSGRRLAVSFFVESEPPHRISLYRFVDSPAVR